MTNNVYVDIVWEECCRTTAKAWNEGTHHATLTALLGTYTDTIIGEQWQYSDRLRSILHHKQLVAEQRNRRNHVEAILESNDVPTIRNLIHLAWNITILSISEQLDFDKELATGHGYIKF